MHMKPHLNNPLTFHAWRKIPSGEYSTLSSTGQKRSEPTEYFWPAIPTCLQLHRGPRHLVSMSCRLEPTAGLKSPLGCWRSDHVTELDRKRSFPLSPFAGSSPAGGSSRENLGHMRCCALRLRCLTGGPTSHLYQVAD